MTVQKLKGSNMEDFIVILVTASSEEEAKKIAQSLVEKRLVACVNIIKDVQSVFRWKGKISDEKELLLIIKTRKKLYKNVEEEIKTLHAYEVPEIIALPIISGSKDYLYWVDSET
ncbi:MAG TPA: divalent-cation tolerance protein CutA [candidate division Zixibacteria bacterium]